MQGCIPMEALGTLDGVGTDDPRRRHIEHCARCSAMLVAYREFVRAEAPTGAHVTAADARLAAFIANRVEGVEAGGAPRSRIGRWFELPSFRFAAAVAVVALVAVIVVMRSLPRSSDVILRGEGHTTLAVETRALSDHAIELQWTPVAEADAYEVAILGEDLAEVARLSVGSDTRTTVDPSTLPASAARWQVTALREGAVVVESTPAALRP